MRRNGILLIQLALASIALAFYPYTPAWLEQLEQHDGSAEAKRSVEDGLTFEMKQRSPKQTPASQAQKAEWQASLLAHKYGQRRSSIAASDGSLARRNSNNFNIQQAGDPKQPKTEGLNQDGTDYSYFIQVELGSNKKNLYMLVDTGAGSSWVMGSDCASQACSLHDKFGPSDSNTLQTSTKAFSISYGSGTVQGTLATDTIALAGMSLKYQFGLASNTSSDFVHFAFDGILGLSMNVGSNQNFLDALASASLLDKNLFAVALNRASDGPNTGEIRFGSTNPAKYTGNIGYTGVAPGDDWAIQLDDMAVNGKKANVGGILAYIDTGTSYMFGPPKEVKALHAVIDGAQSSDGTTWTVPCDSAQSIVATFSGVDYEISPKDWVSPKDNTGKCTSNIYGYEVVPGAWLFGDTFLKNVYAVFDKDQRRIGFASRAASSPSSTTSTASATTTTGASLSTTADTSATTFTTGASLSGSSTQTPFGLTGQETTGSASETAQPTATSSSSAADSFAPASRMSFILCILTISALLG